MEAQKRRSSRKNRPTISQALKEQKNRLGDLLRFLFENQTAAVGDLKRAFVGSARIVLSDASRCTAHFHPVRHGRIQFRVQIDCVIDERRTRSDHLQNRTPETKQTDRQRTLLSVHTQNVSRLIGKPLARIGKFQPGPGIMVDHPTESEYLN